jgi:hypothetical protein
VGESPPCASLPIATLQPTYHRVELIGVVRTDLLPSLGRYDVCTSMIAPPPGSSGSMPATYVTRTIISIHASHEAAVEWRIVMQGEGVFYSAVESLEAFVEELQLQLEEVAGMLGRLLK